MMTNLDRLPSALEVAGVSLSFGGVMALDHVDLTVEVGEVVAIVGSNGSGKTSLLNCVSGIYKPKAGSIHVGGVNVVGRRPSSITRMGVGRSFQGLALPPTLSCLEAAMLGRHVHMRRAGIAAYGLGIAYLSGTEAEHRRAAMAALEEVGCDSWRDHQVADVPFGVAKRVDIARALAGEPKLLLMDEPAAGLSTHERSELARQIQKLDLSRRSIVIVEHDMSFVASVCPRLVVFAAGRLIYDGNQADARANPKVRSILLDVGMDVKPGAPGVLVLKG
jgi:branched-chain amino acid transport system ATP-binding protein